jgi:hypothetical protein
MITPIITVSCRLLRKWAYLGFGGGLLLLLASGCGPAGGVGDPKTSAGAGAGGGGSGSGGGSAGCGPTAITLNVFSENPRTAYANPNLSFTTTLNSSFSTGVTLSGLTGTCSLDTGRLRVSSDTLFPSNVVSISSSNQTNRAGNSPEFRQLQSVYHSDRLLSLLTTLGVSLSSFSPISIDANCANATNNAYYLTSSRQVCLGFNNRSGGRRVWASDDSDVIIHELGHGVNRFLAASGAMDNTHEAGAIDEALADYWALTVNNDAELSEWFLGAISGSAVRDANQTSNVYPASVEFQRHNDSRILSQALWDLRKNTNLGTSATDNLVRRALQIMPSTSRLGNFYGALYDAATLNGLSAGQRTMIVTAFTAKGIHRRDVASGNLQLSVRPGSSSVYVIDDHTYSFQNGGNCNGALDVGETALVLVNLQNTSGSSFGNGIAQLGALPAGISVESGGDIAEYFRINPSVDFRESLPSASYSASYGGLSNRDDATMFASFLLTGGTAGAKSLSMTYAPNHTDPTGATTAAASLNVPFSLTVGSAATQSSCSLGSLWP